MGIVQQQVERQRRLIRSAGRPASTTATTAHHDGREEREEGTEGKDWKALLRQRNGEMRSCRSARLAVDRASRSEVGSRGARAEMMTLLGSEAMPTMEAARGGVCDELSRARECSRKYRGAVSSSTHRGPAKGVAAT